MKSPFESDNEVFEKLSEIHKWPEMRKTNWCFILCCLLRDQRKITWKYKVSDYVHDFLKAQMDGLPEEFRRPI